MDQSKHVKSELKKKILESVSTRRNVFHALKKAIGDKSAKNLELQAEVDNGKRELQACKNTRAMAPVAPSMDRKTGLAAGGGEQLPSSGSNKKSYSDILAGRKTATSS